jgi:2-phospho-L-lactate guanylyltransferase
MTPEWVVIVPLKSFTTAKGRLRSHLGSEAATSLARSLAGGVVAAARPRRIIVVTDDTEVVDWAQHFGVETLRQSSPGLNAAVQEAYRSLDGRNIRAVITHGDLAQPQGLGNFTADEGITLYSDHHREGTNVLVLPSGLDFTFQYGPNSLQRHREEAVRLHQKCTVVTDSPWSHDIDEVTDLDR